VALNPKYGTQFQPVEDFLSGSTQAYQYVQNELCTAENVRHLREACSESVYDAIQESSSELEEWRRENGDKSGMIFDSVEPFFQEIAFPDNFESKSSITASVAFYAQVRQQSDPDTVLNKNETSPYVKNNTSIKCQNWLFVLDLTLLYVCYCQSVLLCFIFSIILLILKEASCF